MILYSNKKSKKNNTDYFKKYLLFSIIIYFFLIFFLSNVFGIETNKIWFFFGVPAKNFLFSDIYPFFVNIDCKIVSDNLIDYYNQFKNCDPWNRLFNYMPIWLHFLKLGINQNFVYLFGFLLVAIYYFSFFKLIKIKSKNNFYIYLFLILSPVSMLAVERGNTDLLIFSLILLFLYFCRLKSFYKISFGYIIIFFASLIKFYPIFVVFVFFKKNIENKFLSLMTFTLFVFYFFYNFDQINIIKQNTLESPFFSYGYNVFESNFLDLSIRLNAYKDFFYNFVLNKSLINFQEAINPFIHPSELKNNYFIVSKLLFLFSIFLSFILFFKKKEFFSFYKLINYNNYYPEMISGAFIFCGTFILGANWDYRLIFLILLVPNLIFLIEKNNSEYKKYLKLLIYSVLLIFWLSPFSVFLFGLDEILIWLIFLFLTILIVNHLFFSFCSKLIK